MAAIISPCHASPVLDAFSAQPTNHNFPPTLISKAPFSEGAWLWWPRCVQFDSLQPVDSWEIYGPLASISHMSCLASLWLKVSRPSSGILVRIDTTTSDTCCLLSRSAQKFFTGLRSGDWESIPFLPQGMGWIGLSLSQLLRELSSASLSISQFKFINRWWYKVRHD